jgi:hypothetical protein
MPKSRMTLHAKAWLRTDKARSMVFAGLAFVVVAGVGSHYLLQSHAASNIAVTEPEIGTMTGGATSISDTTASGNKAIRFNSPSASQSCTNPIYETSQQLGVWHYSNSLIVNNNVWGPRDSTWSQTQSACSPANWYVTANFKSAGGAIQSYPDTQYLYSGKTVAQYTSMQTCFAETAPTGGEWDFGYDNWLNNYGIEIMVWNDWTDTGIYPPASARAVTIDGIKYHTWKGGGGNEWIYTRDTLVKSGCFDVLSIMQDLIAHPSTSGITPSSVPNAIEYGVEIASTNGTTTFQITNFTVDAH